MTPQTMSLESDILSRLQSNMTPEQAKALMQFEFDGKDVARMQELLDKGSKGEITSDEKEEADTCERVGNMISILKALARRTLKHSSSD